MLFNKKLSVKLTQSNSGVRAFLLLPVLLLLVSCTTTHIPGLDRVLFSGSSAQVGPVVAADEPNRVVDVVSVIETNDSAVDPVSQPGVLISKTAPQLKPSLLSKPETGPEPSAPVENTPSVSLPEKSTAKQLVKNVTLAKEIASEPSVKNDSNNAVDTYGTVVGKVVLLGDSGQSLPVTGTLVTLTSKKVNAAIEDRPSKVHVIDMKDKQYQPRYSTINAGDQVVFVNKDDIQHNVFSSSGSNAFDLGTYGSGLKRAVTLKEPGVVKIYCNIHADMAMFMAVGNQDLSAQTDDQGAYQIDNVVPGIYEVTIWNIRGEIKQTVEVKANQTVNLNDQIDTVALKIETHKNKFGGEYSKGSSLFKDEFY